MDAIDAEPDDEAALTITFTGTCAERLFIGRLAPTTIVGRRTRTTGTPTLDATGTDGPAISIYARPVTLRGFTVTGGSGTDGGDPAGPAHGGGLYIESSTVTLVDMRITRNETRNDGHGGGIYASAALGGVGSPPSPARLVIRGRTVITDNTAAGDGGGIHADPGMTVRVTGSTRIHANHATDGGGISITGSDTETTTLLLRDRATVTGNDASSGGGIHGTGSLEITIASGASVQTNTASVGGGLYIDDVGRLRLLGLVAGNTATVGGGGIYLSTAFLVATATARITGNEGGTGGGIASLDSSVVLGGTLVSGNRATTDEGGGIFLNGDLAGLITDGARITGNRARTNGGGIYLRGTATAELTDTTITGNRAGFVETGASPGGCGAGIALVGASELTLRGTSLIAGNRSTLAVLVPGAGICAKSSTVTIGRGATIRGNRFTQSGDGGGIGVANGTLSVTGPVTISGNTATSGDGGGIRAEYSTTTLTRLVLADNAAGERGGGISTYEGSVTVGASTIRGNTAAFDGGGISVAGTSGLLIVDTVTIAGNAAAFGGGGIAIQGGGAFVRDSVVRDNTAESDGGGIAIGAATQIHDTLITGNRGRAGGGLAVSAELAMSGGAIRDNRSVFSGGGVSTSGDGPISFTGTRITGNLTPWEGGGIYVGTRSAFSLGSGALVQGNIARRHGGGGIYFEDSIDWTCSSAVRGNTPDDVMGVSGGS
ncbi:MAG: beta strand repeat-containing protein, partial [Chloroflexota bacterium]